MSEGFCFYFSIACRLDASEIRKRLAGGSEWSRRHRTLVVMAGEGAKRRDVWSRSIDRGSFSSRSSTWIIVSFQWYAQRNIQMVNKSILH